MSDHEHVVTSLTADAIVERAKECYALGLITEDRLRDVTRKAYTIPGYDPIVDLPLIHEVEAERALRREAARRADARTLLSRILRR